MTTMNVDTTRARVALYLGVTGLGLIAPTATLAGRTSVEKRLPLVATSSTQFVRPPGSTVGSAEGGHPNLVRAAAPANGRGGDGRGRAVYASKTVIRPLAAPKTGEAR
ncbi:MAG TPA: hypothetical protein VGR18_00710 [Rubrobacter sp.]|nr:hypothetical protein [Rubrobacter sp.]